MTTSIPAIPLTPAGAPQPFTCPAGIRRSDCGTGTILWVQSPRTGKRIEMFLGSFAEMLPARFVSRVTHANANGRGEVDFTLDELKAFKKVVDTIADLRRQQERPAGGGRPHGFWASSGRGW